MSVGRFLSGFIVGGAVGALTGILLAPSSGEETRKGIIDASNDVCKNTEEQVKELQDKANVVIDDIQTKGDELLSKVQDLIDKKGEEN